MLAAATLLRRAAGHPARAALAGAEVRCFARKSRDRRDDSRGGSHTHSESAAVTPDSPLASPFAGPVGQRGTLGATYPARRRGSRGAGFGEWVPPAVRYREHERSEQETKDLVRRLIRRSNAATAAHADQDQDQDKDQEQVTGEEDEEGPVEEAEWDAAADLLPELQLECPVTGDEYTDLLRDMFYSCLRIDPPAVLAAEKILAEYTEVHDPPSEMIQGLLRGFAARGPDFDDHRRRFRAVAFMLFNYQTPAMQVVRAEERQTLRTRYARMALAENDRLQKGLSSLADRYPELAKLLRQAGEASAAAMTVSGDETEAQAQGKQDANANATDSTS